ncbi:MAG TPA: hypothetical protein PK014_02245 [Thermoanaerobaculia bacterium]|mgnify:CR=1 FL=1|nr:hypothetical protein [Thermoanaerobaculia bacterium]HUM28946.1 hypothetical protein [Thermoanaerobaculia bacterium]HXK67122.1 hypothetical protein [Thermoanaerobaculia bacterium]
MRVRFFGQFLLEKGLIRAADLKDALKIQSNKKQFFGAYALRLGYLEVAELNELLRAQKRTGQRVGELAVEQGLLSRKQVEEILTKQKNDHIFLGEILVSSGVMSREELYRYLDEFHREMKELQSMGLPEELPYNPLFHRLFQIFSILIGRILGGPVKLVDGGMKESLVYPLPTAAVRCIQRDQTFRVILTSDAGLGPYLIRGYVGNGKRKSDPDMLCAVLEEILNIAVGNFLTYAQQMGEVWELEPPIILAQNEPILPLYGDMFHEVLCASPQGEAVLSLDIGGQL